MDWSRLLPSTGLDNNEIREELSVTEAMEMAASLGDLEEIEEAEVWRRTVVDLKWKKEVF